jgi:DNA-binding NarL/FixJ family response regulator
VNQLASVEVRILSRLVRGENYIEIATAEYLSSRTVRRLVSELKRQTGVTNLAGLCVEATRRGWLKVSDQA